MPVLIAFVEELRSRDLLHRVLISQHAGLHSAGEPGGGDFSTSHPVLTLLLPALREAGYSNAEIDTLFVRNPAVAFVIGVRA